MCVYEALLEILSFNDSIYHVLVKSLQESGWPQTHCHVVKNIILQGLSNAATGVSLGRQTPAVNTGKLQ